MIYKKGTKSSGHLKEDSPKKPGAKDG